MPLRESLADLIKDELYQAAEEIRPTQTLTPEYVDHPIKFAEEILGATLTDDQKIILRSVRDNRITLVPSANANGKTYAAGGAAIWWGSCFAPSKVILTAAPPEDNLRRLLWGELTKFLEHRPELLPSSYRALPASMMLRYSAQHWIEGRTIPVSAKVADREARFSGVHSPHLLFVVDEGDAVPPEIYRAIESCMSGEHDRLLILFNPRSPSGAVYQMIREGIGNVITLTAFSHPNVITGETIIPGAVSRKRVVERIVRWSRPMIDDEEVDEVSTFVVPNFLDGAAASLRTGGKSPPLIGGQVRKITQAELAYMVLGRYPTSLSDQLIDRSWIVKAQNRWKAYVALNGERPPEGIRPRVGQDVAEFGDDQNIIMPRWGGFVGAPIKWSGVDTVISADRGLAYAKRVNPEFHFVDATGIGSSIAPLMRRDGIAQAVGVKVSKSPLSAPEDMGEFKIYRDELWWKVRLWLQFDPSAMLPPSEELEDDLLVLTYSKKSGKIVIMSKKEAKPLLGGRSPDEGDGLALTFAEPEIDDQFEIMVGVPVLGASLPRKAGRGEDQIGLSGVLSPGAQKKGVRGSKRGSKKRR